MKPQFWLFAFLALATSAVAGPFLTPDQWAGKKSAAAEFCISQNAETFAAAINGERLKIVHLRPDGSEESILESPLGLKDSSILGGIAIWKDQIVCSLTKEERLVFISIAQKKITSQQSLPDFSAPKGLAFDALGVLWALSGNSLAELQFTEDGHFNPIHHRGNFTDPQKLFIGKNGHFYISEPGQPEQIWELNSKLETVRQILLPEDCKSDRLRFSPKGKLQVMRGDGTLMEVESSQ